MIILYYYKMTDLCSSKYDAFMKLCRLLPIITLLLITACSSLPKAAKDTAKVEITALTFIDEAIIPATTTYEGTKVGGLSSIDYANGQWFMICDDRAQPRFYTARITTSAAGISQPVFTAVTYLKDNNSSLFTPGIADPEALRVTNDNHIIWSSEGNVAKGIQPFVRMASRDGAYVKDMAVAPKFLISQKDKGPRNNGVFEALTRDYSNNSYWIATELPLKQDGNEPTYKVAQSPVRIAHIKPDGTFAAEYVYMLDKVARSGKLEVNGVTEILSYDKDSFLVLERSYASGHSDGGNDAKIYKVNTAGATDVRDIASLQETSYTPVTKTLLLDMETLRPQLTDGIIDNVEGMTFGPVLEGGKRSLVVISDNNFNSFGKQLNQLILFAVE